MFYFEDVSLRLQQMFFCLALLQCRNWMKENIEYPIFTFLPAWEFLVLVSLRNFPSLSITCLFRRTLCIFLFFAFDNIIDMTNFYDYLKGNVKMKNSMTELSINHLWMVLSNLYLYSPIRNMVMITIPDIKIKELATVCQALVSKFEVFLWKGV